MKKNNSTAQIIFNIINYTLMGLLALSMLYPFIFTLNVSLSNPEGISQGGYFFLPKGMNFNAYVAILSDDKLVYGYINTILRTVLGTACSVFMCCLCAYPLARKDLPHRRGISLFVIFTMLFGGGLIPNYLLYNELGLIDNRLVYILPGLVAAFNVMLIKNFFQGISISLREAAMLDGAGEWYIFTRLYLPLSKPVIATVSLFSAIFHWNSWFDSMIYMTTESKMVVQSFLQQTIMETSLENITSGLNMDITSFTPEGIKAATVIITVLPMIIVYPFVQKFFTKGIMLGGVKE